MGDEPFQEKYFGMHNSIAFLDIIFEERDAPKITMI